MVFSAIKAGNSEVNRPFWPNFEHLWDFMPAHVICNFHKDKKKKNKRTIMPQTISSLAFFNNQGQITPKWLVWSGQNLNLSWLPASLTQIRSIMYMLAWRHHFPIIAIIPNPAGIQTHLGFYACLGYLQVWWISNQKLLRKGGDTIFPIVR